MTLKPDLGRKKGSAVQGHQWTGNQGAVIHYLKPALHYPTTLQASPTTPWPWGYQAPKNLPICLIPQDTSLVGGALRKKEESGPLPPLVTAWVTLNPLMGTIYAADAFPQETALCEVKIDVQSSSRLVRPGLTPSLHPPMPNTWLQTVPVPSLVQPP